MTASTTVIIMTRNGTRIVAFHTIPLGQSKGGGKPGNGHDVRAYETRDDEEKGGRNQAKALRSVMS